METIALQVQGVSKEYFGAHAVKNVDFELREGEVHALLGENGAGKSTLGKIVAGVVSPAAGSIILRGQPVRFGTPGDALKAGIAMVFQETSLIPTLTVAQNLHLGREKAFNRLRGVYISAQQFFQSLNFDVDPTVLVSSLGAAKKQMVEIARAVHFGARIMIFDEPTASLTPEEKHHFFALVQRLRRTGVSIIFITHAIEEALAVSDRVTVMRDGERVLTQNAKELTTQAVVQAMVGRSLSGSLYEKRTSPRPRGPRVLRVENVSMGRMVRNTSFSVYAGQVTGMFGLVGSGRTEIAKIVAGIVKRDLLHGGEIVFDGEPVRFRTPRPAVLRGIVYVTEDRKAEGFFETMGIGANIVTNLLAKPARGAQVIRTKDMVELGRQWIEKLSIRAIGGNSKVIELSGGNQQKVVIARSLVQEPRLIIFDEPTRGVDVGAIADLHRIIHSLADQGFAVLVISSYLPEILTLSDRILVARSGRVVEEFSAEEADETRILYAAVH
jgi:simple sugar transport system ATP-binding protein